MRSIYAVLIFLASLCGSCLLHAQEYLIVSHSPSVDSFINSPGVTFSQVADTLRALLNPADTGEGGALDQWQTFKKIWQERVTVNDSSGTNMFRQYYMGLRSTILAGMDSPCSGTGTYQGAWECIGPDSMPVQTAGKVDCIWADPSNPLYILAGNQGGLFRTTDGGKNWACITDNTVVAGGIMGITSICVNPLNKNTIYLGTGIAAGAVGAGGAAILESFDGGATWQQEIIPSVAGSGSYWDTIEIVQRVYITPDSLRLYAFSGDSVYTRSNVGTGNAWQNITPALPPGASTTFINLQFVPGNQDHFFISSQDILGGNMSGIWYASDSMGSSWTEITAPPFTADTYYGHTNFRLVSISMPDADTLFFSVLLPGVTTALYKYSLSDQQFHLINPSIPDNTDNGTNKGELIVSNAATTNNAGLRNIYFGWDVPYHSWNGGISFVPIGDYSADPTHGDIRGMYLQQATNTLRGDSDLLVVATDGGVSIKQAGTDDAVAGAGATHDISGKGLTPGTFWSFANGEKGGLGAGTMMHDGINTYEPSLTPKWANVEVVDAWYATIDRSDPDRAFLSQGFGFVEFQVTTSSGTTPSDEREMGGTPANVAEPFDAPFDAIGVGAPFATDIYGNILCIKNNFWRKRPTDAVYSNTNLLSTPWGFPVSTPVFAGTTYYGAYLAFNPDDSDYDGYALYNTNTIAITGADTAYSSSQVIYYRSPSAGPDFYPNAHPTFGTVPGTPFSNINGMATDPNNTNRVWVCMGGGKWNNIYGENYSDGTRNRVAYSPDHGTTWIDVSNGLPQRIGVSRIVYNEVTGILYCATDAGMYQYNFASFNPSATYTNTDGNQENTSISWTCFNQGKISGHNFPNVTVTDMSVNHCAGKLYAATFGRSIWSTDIYPPNTIPVVVDSITSTTNWTGPHQYITGSIYIAPGAVLNITGDTLHMPKNGAITVARGGRLNITNSLLTNDCDQCFWHGIAVVGNSLAAQTPANQGVVTINNSTLQHAVMAVANFNSAGDSTNTYGGIIQAANAYFTDNQNDATFRNYLNIFTFGYSATGVPNPDLSYFHNCTFLLDNNYKGDALGLPATYRVSLQGVAGIGFTGCRFLNRDAAAFSKDKGEGIHAVDAGFNLTAFCSVLSPSGCVDEVRPRFCGFTSGINVEGIVGADLIVNIDQADFDTVTTGIFVSAYNNVSATSCNFTIGNGPGQLVFGGGSSGCYQNIGILTQNSTLFHTEGNAFTGTTATTEPLINFGTVLVNDVLAGYFFSGASNLYRNTYHTLGVGVLALGDNTGYYPISGGVQILCNNFSDNNTDISVVAQGAASAPQGIAYYQGSPAAAAGNTFSGSVFNIVNNTHYISYYYDPAASSISLPPNVSSGIVTVYPATAGNTCPSSPSPFSISQMGSGKTATRMAVFHTHKVALGTDVDDYNRLIDNGSTSALVNLIDTSTSAKSLNKKLGAISPWLSETALMEAGTIGLLNKNTMLNLLSENPDVLRDGDFVDSIKHVCGFTATQVNNLLDSSLQLITSRTTMEGNIADLELKMGKEANTILMILKSPTDSSLTESDTTGQGICTDSTSIYYTLDSNTSYAYLGLVDSFLADIGTEWSWYARIGNYNNSQNYAEADKLFTSLQQSIGADYNVHMYNKFKKLWDVLYPAEQAHYKSATGSVYPITNLPQAVGFSSLDTGSTLTFTDNNAMQIIWNITTTLNPYPGPVFVYPAPCTIVNGHLTKRQADTTVTPAITGANDAAALSVYPNPASGVVTFSASGSAANLNIIVTNMLGAKVATITGSSGTANWDTRAYPPGVYIYQASDTHGLIKTGKLVVVK